MMIPIDDGIYIASELVAKLVPEEKVLKTRLKDRKGNILGYFTGHPEHLAEYLVPIVPAAPGFFVLEQDLDNPEAEGSIPIMRRAVLGWRMGLFCHPMPVTLDYPPRGQDWAILLPDGSVEDWWQTFASVEEWLKATKLEREWKAERKAEKRKPIKRVK